jgi:erythromycin esterase
MSDSSVEWDEEELAGIAQAVGETTLAIEADAPGESLPARSPVADTVGDATVVGLGETGHGIRECFQLRHQLLRVLVEELGYRDIGLEVDFSATAQLNQYLSTGQGSAEAALAVEGFYDFWECRSMVTLVEWARSFNESRDTADQIRFHGIDVQNGRPTLTALDSYLDTVDPTVRDQLADSFRSVLDQRVGVKGQPDDPDEYGDTCREIAAVLDEQFTDKRATYIERSSRRAYERARRQVEHVDRLADLVPNRYGDDQQTAMQLRESGMADTVS